MWTWSNCTITLGKSLNFARLGLMIHLAALVMLLFSGLPLVIKIALVITMLAMACSILLHPYPALGFSSLRFYQARWHLQHKQGHTERYERHRVMLEAGLFFLLELSNPDKRRVIVIFFDQLPHEQYRMLRVLQRIN